MMSILLNTSLGAVNIRSVATLALLVAAPLLMVAAVIWRTTEGIAQRIGVGSVLALAGLALALGLWQLSLVKMRLSQSALQIGGGAYTVRVDLGSIDLDAAKVTSLDESEYALEFRTNGIGMPGLALGWHRSSGGKVFAAITGDGDALILPTRLGYTLALSAPAPRELLEQLRTLQQGDNDSRPAQTTTSDQRM